MAANKKIKEKTLKLETPLIIDTLQDGRKKVDAELKNKDTLILSCEGEIAEIDLAGIQFIQYVKRECNARNKPLQMNFVLTPDTRNLLDKCGFSDVFQNLK